MSSSNLLEPLVSVIETIKRRISEHGATLRENETRTRVALIDPILQALGWDVSDPSVVTTEFDVEGRRADYALLRSGDKPAATIEAKRLGEPLHTHRMQMFNYANAKNMDYAGLTDGNHWELYDVFKRGELRDREILNVSIADAPSQESALKLLLLWWPNVASGEPVEAQTPIMGLPQDAPDDVPPKPPGPQSMPQPPDNGIPLTEFDPSANVNPPSRIVFPDGSDKDIRNWKSILVETAEWLHQKRILTLDRVPLRYGPKTIVVNAMPVTANNNQMQTPYNVGAAGLYVESHGNRTTVVQRTKAILKSVDIDLATVYILPAE